MLSNDVVTPVKVGVLQPILTNYPHRQYLVNGFTHGFHLGYEGPRFATTSPNLKSCNDDPDLVLLKLQTEISLYRIKGPFTKHNFPNLRISPIGLVPNK